jgi:hypothetical protein
MKTIFIPINKRQWLSDALKEASKRNQNISANGYIPTNTILNKTLPGLGATYGELKAKRHSIIIEPNVPVIIGKTKNNPNYLAVCEGCTVPKIKRYMNDSNIKDKKLLTTPESYHKIKDACTDLGIDIYDYFFCLFDECEKLVQDVDYRSDITQPINDFFNFKNKAFVSATCLEMTHPEFVNQNFQKTIIKPTFFYKKNLNLIMTDNFEFDVIKRLDELKESKCVCVFMNKTDSIDDIIYTLGIEKDSKVFCSEKSVNKLKTRGFNNAYDNIDLPLAKYNFFTCRFFSAVDIEIREKPDILILTNIKSAIHTMIDPFSEAIQIYGRFRDKYHNGKVPFNSLTHITNFKPDMKIKSKHEIDLVIKEYHVIYSIVEKKLQNATNASTIEAAAKNLASLPYNDFLGKDGKFNDFSRDNLYNEERVKEYYTNPILLSQAYKRTKHFVVKASYIHNQHTIAKNLFKSRGHSAVEKRKQIVDELFKMNKQKATNPMFDTKLYKTILERMEISNTETGQMIVEAYHYLGKAEIERIGYGRKAKLENAVKNKKEEEKAIKSFSIILNDIIQNYSIGNPVSKNELKNFLTEQYRLNGINIRVTQDTIKKYCFGTSNNGVNPATFTIQGHNSKYGE